MIVGTGRGAGRLTALRLRRRRGHAASTSVLQSKAEGNEDVISKIKIDKCSTRSALATSRRAEVQMMLMT